MPRFSKPASISDVIYQNIDSDLTCPEALLSDLINQFRGCTNLAEAESCYLAWQRSIDRTQITIDRVAVALVGRVHFRRALVDYITAAVESNVGVDVVPRADIENTILFYAQQPSILSKLEAERIFSDYVRALPIYWRWVWLFLIDGAIDLTNDLASNSCLPWRLGLDRVVSGSQYIAMTFHSAAAIDLRKPCVPDVDFSYHEFWRPGGATVPRADRPPTCSNTPCTEVVASPMIFGQAQQFRLVIAR